jgi:hypothetical protein
VLVQPVHAASLYGRSAARLVVRGGREIRLPRGEPCGKHVFVVGCPRSGTTFLAEVLGQQPGLIDLGEASPVKAAIPELAQLSEEDATARLQLILARVRRLGLVAHLRGVEQTPEMCFVLDAALQAHPEARAVHMLRDGRDVVCSLLERGWLKASRPGRDEVGQPHGAHARFWVEPERRDEFASVSEAARGAWAWRRHVTAALAAASKHPERTLELRYEELTTNPGAGAERLALHLGLDRQLLAASLAAARDRSVGRWRRDLTPEQLEDVGREAGPLLRELGYGGTSAT